jgi:hypothetical protein
MPMVLAEQSGDATRLHSVLIASQDTFSSIEARRVWTLSPVWGPPMRPSGISLQARLCRWIV